VVVAAATGRRRRGTPTLCPMCTAHCTLWQGGGPAAQIVSHAIRDGDWGPRRWLRRCHRAGTGLGRDAGEEKWAQAVARCGRQGAGGARRPRTPPPARPLPPLTCHCTELEVTEFQDIARLDLRLNHPSLKTLAGVTVTRTE
jgi:hypothetical protein